jgi:hypothetical protein
MRQPTVKTVNPADRTSRPRPHAMTRTSSQSTTTGGQGPQHASGDAILEDAEVAHRMLALAELRATLARLGVQSVLARRHRLVLRYNDPPPLAPSGPTEPTLHVFAPDRTHIATTDGNVYRLDSGLELPASDPGAAAASIHHLQAAGA